jgi:hypothetical protein
MPSMSRLRPQQQREAGFIGMPTTERLVVVSAFCIYAAFALPLVKRFYAQSPSALFLPFVPLALFYIGGFIAALICPSRDPLSKETFTRRGFRFGNIAFVASVLLLTVIAMLRLAGRR